MSEKYIKCVNCGTILTLNATYAQNIIYENRGYWNEPETLLLTKFTENSKCIVCGEEPKHG